MINVMLHIVGKKKILILFEISFPRLSEFL